ncbi:MAG: mechanosensitive ion channel domain-containing protein [Chloroflexota bacterium]
MSSNVDIQVLSDLLFALLQFGERLVVQRQIIGFAVVLCISWTLSKLLWHFVGERIEEWLDNHVRGRLRRHLEYELTVCEYTILPILGIFGLNLAHQYFAAQEWHSGLLDRFSLLFWAILAYRLFLGLLYARLGSQSATRYHYRFIGPLFFVGMSGWFLNNLVPLRRLAEIKLWDGFTDPITLGSLLLATLGFYFWYDGSGVAQDLLRSLLTPRATDPGAVEATLIILRYISISIGIAVAMAVLGFDSTTLAFVTGGLSVGIGFGSKEIISNLISGILLLFDQSLRPGDVVSVEGQMGTVSNIGIRSITVNTLNNVDVVIPNQTLLTSSVTTYTKSDRLVRTLLSLETADCHPPDAVREALLEVTQWHPAVAEDPAPVVFFLGNGDTSHKFELAVWFEDPLRTKALSSELYYMIYDEFTRRGIGPSTPQRDLQVLNWPTNLAEQPARVQQQNQDGLQARQAVPHRQSAVPSSNGGWNDQFVQKPNHRRDFIFENG